MICDSDVIVDTNADVNPTKGDIPTLTNADVYNYAMVLVDDLCVSPTKGDASCVSDVPALTNAEVYNSAVISVHDSYVPLTKGDASCVSFAD